MKNLEDRDLTPLRDTLIIESIDRDFAVIDDISKVPFFEYPAKIDVAVSAIVVKGSVETSIDLKRHVIKENQIIAIRPDQILQYHYISNDFSGRFVVMSQNFLDSIQIYIGEQRYPLFLAFKDNPIIQCSQYEMELCLEYFTLLDKAVKMRDNPNRIETVKYLTLALLYALNTFSKRHQDVRNEPYSRKDVIFESFYKLIQLHHKENRTVTFYADKLCLTPKYLTTVIKEATGTTAHNWINEYVILSAKAMLKSTTKTVQEISNELTFANQSFFGKYFKQYVGMSPGEYRKVN